MLELRHVTKRYDDKVIFEDLSLKINTGEIVSILGPSGCGKTTLLHMILGLTDISGGRIAYNGEDITRVSMRQRGFNIVFQDYALFPNLNVKQNIEYGLRNNPSVSTQQEVDELIDLLDIKAHLNKRIHQLSGGQKQRVALARTLVNEAIHLGVSFTAHAKVDFDDGFSVPLHFLDPGLRIPFIPVLVNCFVPPQPKPERCYEVARKLKSIIETKWPGNEHIAIIGTGGLSHEPGGPKNFYVDE
ncbi:MAG: ATP-binding cassette domain-containing protein, partial [Psychrobacter sp.]|nr:ATP-binding cassette domain-containing protein [Psychrobacter sp.]